MTYKELIIELQKLPPEALEGRADVLDFATNRYYEIQSIYNKKKCERAGYYTFLSIKRPADVH